jgi:hypothetical protein
MFAIWTEHIDSTFNVNTMITSEIKKIKAGMMLISCGEQTTNWYLYGIYDTFDEAYAVHSKLLDAEW